MSKLVTVGISLIVILVIAIIVSFVAGYYFKNIVPQPLPLTRPSDEVKPSQQPINRSGNEVKAISLTASGDVLIPDSMRNCVADANCVFVASQCGACRYGAINMQFRETYQEQFSILCKDYQGGFCDTELNPGTVTKCLNNQCTMVVSDRMAE